MNERILYSAKETHIHACGNIELLSISVHRAHVYLLNYVYRIHGNAAHLSNHLFRIASTVRPYVSKTEKTECTYSYGVCRFFRINIDAHCYLGSWTRKTPSTYNNKTTTTIKQFSFEALNCTHIFNQTNCKIQVHSIFNCTFLYKNQFKLFKLSVKQKPIQNQFAERSQVIFLNEDCADYGKFFLVPKHTKICFDQVVLVFFHLIFLANVSIHKT